MINIAICDDDKDASDLIKKLITKIISDNHYNMNVTYVTDSQKEIYELVADKKVDALFLDIKFEGNKENGLTLAKKLREINNDFYLIFITGYFEYAMLSFEHKTFDFILKPASMEKLESTLFRLNEEINLTQNNLITFKNNIVLNPNEILFIQKSGYKAIIHTKNNKLYNSYGTIKELTDLLPSNFVQSHRAFIVNKKLINCVDRKNNLIHMIEDTTCPMSDSYRKYLI